MKKINFVKFHYGDHNVNSNVFVQFKDKYGYFGKYYQMMNLPKYIKDFVNEHDCTEFENDEKYNIHTYIVRK